jgi:DNA-binding XRE family transcriptional regulator
MTRPRTTQWSQTRSRRPVDEHAVTRELKQLRAEQRAYRLREIREALGMTQTELAERMRITQPTVSALEAGELDRSAIATLKAYVEALGGTVEVTARFGKEHLVLLGGDG